MKKFIYNKTAFIAVLFYLTNLSAYSNTPNRIQCLIKDQNIVLKIENSSPASFSLKTHTHSEYNQKVDSGMTTLILNLSQFPAMLEVHPTSEAWIISKSCEIRKNKKQNQNKHTLLE